MQTKYIFLAFITVVVSFQLQAQTLMLSGKFPTAFVEKAEIEVKIINLTNPDTAVVIPDVNGQYQWDAAMGSDYKISASVVGGDRATDFLNGVSTLDMVMIQRHILAVEKITNTAYLIAADVNRDNRISTADLVNLRRIILGFEIPSSFTAWILRPSSDLLSSSYLITNLQVDITDLDFKPIKVGDVNGSAVGGG